MTNSIQLFNGLNGTVATRTELENIIEVAKQEEQTHVSTKLENLLSENEDAKFDIELKECAFEVVPESMLNGLQFDEINEFDESGLNKAVSPDEIYQHVTDLMINTIKEVGWLPWQKEWKGTGLSTARNYVTGQPYTGINAMTLPYDVKQINGKTVLIESKVKDIYYLTFNQIVSLGATLKKGSSARRVEYFNFVNNYSDEKKSLKYTTSSAADLGKFVKKHKLTESDLKENLSKYPVLKYYNVFKATDCENLPEKSPIKIDAKPIQIAEKIIELFPNSPKIIIGKEEKAFYSGGGSDEVYMPTIKAFSTESYYYSTFFHELVHSTGHYSRLDRNMSGFFGSSDYAFEELIAELGAVFLCAETGILFNTIENSAKYLKGWNNKLVGILEDDNRFFFRASAMAQKANNLILDLNEKREPAYRKHFEVEQLIKPVATKRKPIKETGLIELFSKVNKLCKEDLREHDFKRTKHKFKAGDLYRSDFDYKGMLQAGAKVNEKTSTKELEKLYNSFVDVNYHQTSKVLWETLVLLKENKPKKEVSKPTTKSVVVATTKKTRGAKVVEKPVAKTKEETILSKYAVGTSVNWEGKKVTISKVVKFGNDTKFELNLGKNKTIWTDENTLNSETKKTLKKEVATKTETPVKVDKNGQTALFGVKTKPVKTEPKKHSKIQKIALAGNENESEFFDVAGEVGKFLQQVEKKPVESVVITLDGQQGAGKTTTLYKFMESFASTGNDCLFLSLEEHPSSSLAKEKVVKYLSKAAQDKTDSVGEVESIEELYEMITPYDIIFIDSWQKLQRMVGAIRLDEDLRKKFNGKVFVVIFQQTTTGRTKGGAEVVFDGDIIIKMVKENSFADNYAYFDKNRYTKIAIEDIRYNIASGKVYNPNATEEPATELQPVEEVEFSFIVE